MSINLNWIPFITIVSSILSLVVPSISETIALSSFNKAFKRDDFPAFGFPIIATGTPFLITLPYAKESDNSFNCDSMTPRSFKNSSL